MLSAGRHHSTSYRKGYLLIFRKRKKVINYSSPLMIYLQRKELLRASQCGLFGNEERKLTGVVTLHGLFPSE